MIQSMDRVKDLGVMMSTNGKFDDHARMVASKTQGLMGWMKCSFMSRDFTFLKFFWRTYILPHLDYASQLWALAQSSSLELLEGLLRTFMTWFPGTQDMSYWERLSFLKMSSIQRRFERYRVLYTWKILQEKVPNCGISWHSTPTTGRLCLLPASKECASVRTLRAGSFQV